MNLTESPISDREAQIITAVIALILCAGAVASWREILMTPWAVVPAIVGIPMIAFLVWRAWGRTSPHWSAYALVLAAALGLPLGALGYTLTGWIFVAFGYSPLFVAAVFWACGAFVVFRKIVEKRN